MLIQTLSILAWQSCSPIRSGLMQPDPLFVFLANRRVATNLATYFWLSMKKCGIYTNTFFIHPRVFCSESSQNRAGNSHSFAPSLTLCAGNQCFRQESVYRMVLMFSRFVLLLFLTCKILTAFDNCSVWLRDVLFQCGKKYLFVVEIK